MGRSIEEPISFMGEDKWPNFGPFKADGTRDIPGKGSKKTSKIEFTSNYRNTMNAAIAAISGRNYPAINKAIISLDVTWKGVLNNSRGVLPAFDQDYWNLKVHNAYAQTSVIYLKWITDLLSQYEQGVNFQDANSLDATAAMLSAEFPKVTAPNLVFPVTRMFPQYKQATALWKAKIAQLRLLAKEARAAGVYTPEQAATKEAIVTEQQVTDIQSQQAYNIAMARGDFAPVPANGAANGTVQKTGFNFMPLVIGAVAIGGGFLLLKG